MKKLKIMTVVGTRPEIIRLSRVISKLNQYTHHILVHTGQNYDYELNQIFFDDLQIKKPDYFLNAAKGNASQTIGNIIIEMDAVIEKEHPDAVLVLGDTNSCMSIIPAKKRKIPIFHMEAGNRCFDMRVPEEINRRIIDHLADINLAYSAIARSYLINEGIKPETIIKVGSPMKEVLDWYKSDIENSLALQNFSLKKNNFFLISAHREENIEDSKNFNNFVNVLNSLASHFKIPIIVSTHPRTRKKIDESNLLLEKEISLIKPLGFFDYNKLQMTARIVLSDSGTINEESSILNFKAINIRETHERPEAMEEASTIMTGFNFNRILQAIEVLNNQLTGTEKTLNEVNDYTVTNVSEKIVRIIYSYIDYVNRETWKKY
jgi:UDP-N-acetylglucosamine 2-epimerase